MAIKSVNISNDGTTFYTLPGNTGEWDDNLQMLDDTIFGEGFQSSQPGLLDWKVTANALYKGFAGYNAKIYSPGTSTLATSEATTNTTGSKYQITATAHQVIDHTQSLVVKDGSTDISADIVSVDYLFGIVDLGSYSVIGAITFTYHYIPLVELAKYRSFSLTQQNKLIELTDLPTAHANSGTRTFGYGLAIVKLQTDGIYAEANAYRTEVVARNEMIISITPDGGGKTVARGYFRPAGRKQSGKVGELEVETVNFELSVPAVANMVAPFRWNFTSTDLTMAVQILLNAFDANTVLTTQYLPDSTNGAQGSCILADVSLSGGYESMNEFACTLQGTGTVTSVGTGL